MNWMRPKQPMSRSIWRAALLARGCMRNFWNSAPASGPMLFIIVRPLACASAFRFPCAKPIGAPTGHPLHFGNGRRLRPPSCWQFRLPGIALFPSRTSSADLIAQDVLSSHLRSLIGAHLLDVPSSDQHTVKPWFNGKLDFSPEVRDFTAQGYPLIGGRIDYARGRPVAALVYQRRKHVINVFTGPSAAADGGAELDHNGYHVVHWNISGMTWWAVSDLNAGELRQFVDLYRP